MMPGLGTRGAVDAGAFDLVGSAVLLAERGATVGASILVEKGV